ncbi:restriction endonuclease subunit S [Citrobacter braakii]
MMHSHMTTISEIARVFDGPHATPKKISSGPYFLSISSLDKGRLDLTKSAFLSEEDFTKWTKRVTPEEGDLLFSYETRLGEAALMPAGVRACLGRRMGLLRINKDKAIPEYVLYAYLSPAFQQTIKANTLTGATVDRLSISEFPDFPIRIPPLGEQEKVANLLGSIDKKIDLNNRINAELEAMAKTLYDYWFVQFDFPDANGKPYKTSGGNMEYNATLKREIPAGWNSCKLSEFIKLEYGKPLKSEYRTGSGYPVFGSSGIVGFHVDYLVEGPGLIIGRKGTVGKVNYSFENFYPIDTAYYVSCKKITSMIFLNYLINSLGLEGMNSDSAVPGLNREATLGISIVSAPLELISKYHEYAESWFEKKKIIVEENNALIKLRDWLLPMLMNGQVTVR